MAEEGKKRIRIREDQPYKKLGDLFGIFFEDINHAADGGLYAELVQNRSFEFDPVDNPAYNGLTAWKKSGKVSWQVMDQGGLNEQNPHWLRVETAEGGTIENCGFGAGMFVEAGKQYRFSVFAGFDGAGETAHLNVAVRDAATKEICAGGSVMVCGTAWKRYEIVMTASLGTEQGVLELTFGRAGAWKLDMVSLFPADTFCGRENGLRRDIAEALAQLHPKFMRFPGGCLVHDGSLNENDRNSMYRWKNTIGPVEARPARRNNWGYNQTLGLGYYEYFCFCEDIGAKPLPVLPGGFNPHKGEGVPLEELDIWVKEALDLIEFANGDETTAYGKLRAELGHPEPFGLEYLAIGNEEIGDGFFERYPKFHEAIRKAWPGIKIINSAGPFASGEGYEAGWTSAKKYGSDLIDEHYYASPEWFLANMHHYEDYDPNGPKVFLGEYASWGNTWYNALVEAAYMTHLERSRAVALACYAPMLCHKDYVNWKPDLLWFDNHQILKTPNYYVQQLFMKEQGTDELKIETEGLDEIIPLTDTDEIHGAVTVRGNDIEGRISEITLTDETTGNVTHPDDLAITRDPVEYLLGTAQSRRYSLEFTFQRSAGRKGLYLAFGQKDADNRLVWEFGGWDNWDCNVTAFAHGRGSTISHRIFHVTDQEYRLRLEVDGGRIRTFVNGELYNDVKNPQPCLEELYLCASREADGKTVILKAVNLTGEEKIAQIELQHSVKQIQTQLLSGFSLDAENTFDEPKLVAPRTETQELTADQKTVTWRFAPHSVTVLKLIR